MARFYGKIGFSVTEPTSRSVYEPKIVERYYAGDVFKNYSRFEKSNDGVNDNVNIANDFSILSDPYALDPFHTIRYIEWLGALWKVTGVLVEYPRLRLTIGGIYDGPTPDET